MPRYHFEDCPTPSSPSTPWATLTASVNASAGTIAVSSKASFPQAVQFDIVIGNETLTVTGDAGGLDYTVTRGAYGSTAASHASGDGIFHVLTAAGLLGSPGAMTSTGDLQYLASSGLPARLAAGADGEYLRYLAGVPIVGPILLAHLPDASSLYVTPASLASTLAGYLPSTLPGNGKLLYDNNGSIGGFGSWDGTRLEIAEWSVFGSIPASSAVMDAFTFEQGRSIGLFGYGVGFSGSGVMSDLDTGHGAEFYIASFNGTPNAPTPILTGHEIGVLRFVGYNSGDGVDPGFDEGVFIKAIATADAGEYFIPAKLQFEIYDAAGVKQAPLVINPASVVVAGGVFATNLSGTNTGDQDLSSYLTTTAAGLAYQPLDSDLTAIAALSTNGFAKRTGSGTWAIDTATYLTSVTAHNLLSATHGDTTAGSVARGDVITGQGATPTWTRLAKGTANQVLAMDGTATDVVWVTPASGAAWGGITGTLSSQTDLQSALDLKAALISPSFTTPVLGVATGTRLTLSPSGTVGLTVSGATETTSQPVISTTQTWNASGSTFIADLQNITDTASAAASLLIDRRVGNASVFTVRKDGLVKSILGANDYAALAPRSLQFQNNSIGGTVLIGDNGSGVGIVAFGAQGLLTFQSTNRFDAGAVDVTIKRAAAAVVQFGVDINGAAVSQTLQAANGITGTDKTGGNLTIASGKGTGAGAVSAVLIQTPGVLASGTTAQSLTTRLTVDSSGILATGYKSSDGSAGVTAGPFTTITAITVKNGLITAITGS